VVFLAKAKLAWVSAGSRNRAACRPSLCTRGWRIIAQIRDPKVCWRTNS